MHMVGFRENKLWLSVAIKVGVAVITFAIGVAANLACTIVRTPSTPQLHSLEANYANAEVGTLKHRILEAKAKGDNKVELSILACGWEIGSLKQALSRDTVVLADLQGKKTYEHEYQLHTWYRFKIKETLLKNPNPPYPYLFQSGPSDMLPIAEDEFLIAETNGQMEIDGVTVTQRSNGAKYLEAKRTFCFCGSTRRNEQPFALELIRLVSFLSIAMGTSAHTSTDPIL